MLPMADRRVIVFVLKVIETFRDQRLRERRGPAGPLACLVVMGTIEDDLHLFDK